MRGPLRIGALITSCWIGAAAVALAQQPPAAPAVSPPTVRLTVDAAVAMALDHNVDLAAERLTPRIGDTQVAAAAGAFRPVFNTSLLRNDQLQPPASFLVPVATRNDAVTSELEVKQQ